MAHSRDKDGFRTETGSVQVQGADKLQDLNGDPLDLLSSSDISAERNVENSWTTQQFLSVKLWDVSEEVYREITSDSNSVFFDGNELVTSSSTAFVKPADMQAALDEISADIDGGAPDTSYTDTIDGGTP